MKYMSLIYITMQTFVFIMLIMILFRCSGSGSEIGNPLDIDSIIPLDTVRIRP